MALSFADAIGRLDDKRSAQRRSGAKRLRKLGDPAAGPALTAAIDREMADPRTWETQYQMIMALGACGYKEAVPTLQKLAQRQLEHLAVYTALGHAVVQLSSEDGGAQALRWCLDTQNPELLNGALRATATLRLFPDEKTISLVVGHVERTGPYDGLRFWAAVAAAGWAGRQVETFLKNCAAGPRDDVAQAATSSLRREYASYPVP